MIAWKCTGLVGRGVLLLAFVSAPLACGEADSDPKSGPSGGRSTGAAGAASGGTAQGGKSSTSGGVNASGGRSTGGSASGGTGNASGNGGEMATGGGDTVGTGGSDTSGAGGAGGGRTSAEGGTTSTEGGAPSGGIGGGGGSVDEPPPDCDDHNLCTRDTFDGSACRHEPVTNGTPCDDSNLCTLGDSCQSGACQPGAARSGTAAVLGRVEAYGSGTALAFGDDRVLFFDSSGAGAARFTLTRVENGSLHRVSSLDLTTGVPYTPLFSAFGNLAAMTDGSSTVTIGGTLKQVRLFSVALDGTLSARGSIDVPGAIQPAVVNIFGRGTRLFMCANYSFFSAPNGTVHWFDVSDPDAPKLTASAALGVACGSLSASEDGQRVYVNTPNGVRFADLTKYDGSSGTFSYETEPLVSENSGVYVRGQRVLTRSTDLVRVFDETTHQLQTSFNAAGARSAGLADGFVFTQGASSADGSSQAFMTLHDSSGTLVEKRTIATYPFTMNDAQMASILPKPAVVAAGLAVSPIGGQVWSLGNGGFTAIEQIETARPELLYVGSDGVHTRSNTHWNLLDTSTPSAPRWVKGGPHGNLLSGLKLDVSEDPATLLRTAPLGWSDDPTLVPVSAQNLSIQNVTTDTNERSLGGATWSMPGGSARLASYGDSIYRLVGPRFQRFRRVDLEASRSEPFFDLLLDSTTIHALDIDVANGHAVLTYAGTEQEERAPKLSVFDLNQAPPALIETVTLAVHPMDVRLRGDTLAWTDGQDLVFRQVNGAEIRRQSFTLGVLALVAFDGRIAYFTDGDRLQAVSVASDTLLLDTPMFGRPFSLVETPHALVASTAGEVVTLSPACP